MNDDTNAVQNEGRFLIFHFDLANKKGENREARAIIDKMGLEGLTRSVRCIAIPDKSKPAILALDFWEYLRNVTAGKLQDGDAFYVHYASDTLEMTTIYHELGEGETSLGEAPVKTQYRAALAEVFMKKTANSEK